MNIGLVNRIDTEPVGMVRNMMINVDAFSFEIDVIVSQDNGKQDCLLIIRSSLIVTANELVDL